MAQSDFCVTDAGARVNTYLSICLYVDHADMHMRQYAAIHNAAVRHQRYSLQFILRRVYGTKERQESIGLGVRHRNAGSSRTRPCPRRELRRQASGSG